LSPTIRPLFGQTLNRPFAFGFGMLSSLRLLRLCTTTWQSVPFRDVFGTAHCANFANYLIGGLLWLRLRCASG
jgi:hypothetical protein